ncbi:hypothetical protein FHX68_2759 [Microbacterium lacticum]|uniref:Uncharacterized protein n=2 Tax=Microbacterium lacticum TaxID=33885 RepID=A0A4Y3UMN6_9MICO|nr:hypothetical protein FHX68_2759 [Microbacterium lacticum]GEB95384.1 hypothetical protein MLA01_16030 [Microbacterium lacticum]GGI66918.1 hypothetical protein GCM10009724_17320 [Microbacterium lacticum]
MRLQAGADPAIWVSVTGSFGLRGRRHRKRAIGMLLTQASAAMGAAARPGGGFAAWAMSQAAPALLRKADGRVLVWVWKGDPERVVALAQVQQATPQLRTARAMMPMEYDDTEDFRSAYLGAGEKLAVPFPQRTRADAPPPPPTVTYTWDTGTAFVTLTAIGGDRESFGTADAALDDLARSLRLVDDVPLAGGGDVLRLDPA